GPERVYFLIEEEEEGEERGSFVNSMEGQRNDDVSNRPKKQVYSDDHLAVEIPETAHQISSG
ncbi:hypothetical protein Tco_1119219, partial [Tanacetum coccineum]